MQLYPGWPAEQWRGFAAFNAANSGGSTRRDTTGYCAAWRDNYRSYHDRDAYAEHVGMPREHDDEPGYPRNDGAGQCYWGHRNPRRVVPIRLLMQERAFSRAGLRG